MTARELIQKNETTVQVMFLMTENDATVKLDRHEALLVPALDGLEVKHFDIIESYLPHSYKLARTLVVEV